MIRWLMIWHLRRRRDKLAADVEWIRDTIWSAQAQLERVERALRAAQADLWIAESPRSLLDPSRTASGLLPRRQGHDLYEDRQDAA